MYFIKHHQTFTFFSSLEMCLKYVIKFPEGVTRFGRYGDIMFRIHEHTVHITDPAGDDVVLHYGDFVLHIKRMLEQLH